MALLNVPKGQTLWVLAVGKGRLFFLPPAKLVLAPKVDLILIPRRDSVHSKPRWPPSLNSLAKKSSVLKLIASLQTIIPEQWVGWNSTWIFSHPIFYLPCLGATRKWPILIVKRRLLQDFLSNLICFSKQMCFNLVLRSLVGHLCS